MVKGKSTEPNSHRTIYYVLAFLAVAVAVGLKLFWFSVWFVGYDIRNCPGCQPKIDWTIEKEASVVSTTVTERFHEDGAVVLKNVLDIEKVQQLVKEIDNLPNSIMSDVLTRLTLQHYLRYEHHLDTRSELVRDWALYGPLAKWAAELLNVDEGVRLYNAEAIYHQGETSPRPCKPAWHRDTIAAPFPLNVPSVTFNVYFEDIGADAPNGDGLIYMSGSHKNLSSPPTIDDPDVLEPYVKVGDVLAHDPHTIHTTSGRGCWRRRSMQFRYVATKDTNGNTTTFEFGRNRHPHGPVPWSMAQAPELYPHGLENGDVLAGPGYPLAYPKPLDEEHVPLQGNIWTLRKMINIFQETEQTAKTLPLNFHTLDGPILKQDDWESVHIPQLNAYMPMHKSSPGYKQFQESQEF